MTLLDTAHPLPIKVCDAHTANLAEEIRRRGEWVTYGAMVRIDREKRAEEMGKRRWRG
jgi:hypothetical protein